MMIKRFVFTLSASIVTCLTMAQLGTPKEQFTRADTLRGSLNKERTWWNVLRYDLTVTPDYATKTIAGVNTLSFFDNGGKTMQIDLQQPMILDSAVFGGTAVAFKREENVYWLYLRDSARMYKIKPAKRSVTLYFHGKPREAIRPPWDGGWIWKKDDKGRPWMSVACQGLGASVWYPCKDHQSDEPDNGASLTMIVPDTLMAVSNGRMIKQQKAGAGLMAYTWEVKNPINNYTIVPYIGKYVNWTDTLQGQKGKLDLSYWVLDYHLDSARIHFNQVKPMLRAFEYWFGPYPFYEDGYKLVEAPHLGMEHQSAVAYGNKFKNGYLGRDLSGTGWGLKWDYIIVHESGHEWFANNITTADIADMWVHEGFTCYSETLYVDYYFGTAAGNEYNVGLRKGIRNDAPVIGPYGVNKEGSGDMYSKGANILQTLRHTISNDAIFRNILRGLNKTFYHGTVTTKQVENYISKNAGYDYSKVFDQYLRGTRIPVLEYRKKGTAVEYRYVDVTDGFNLPIVLGNGKRIIPVKDKWQALTDLAGWDADMIQKQFYVVVREVN